MVFFRAKKLMERWYLLNTEKLLFWTFRRWEIRSFLETKSWWKDDIYWLLESSGFELFGDEKYGLFFESKSWWKDDIYLVYFSLPWYSRTCEIWFFVQWWILVLTNLLIILHTIFVLISSLALYTKHYDRKI